MLSTTWTPAELRSELRPYERHVWRVVEAQHIISTRKIVDSNDEQRVLEDLIEATKPPYPAECDALHFLLKTPFRYGAGYPKGSRFRRRGRTPGVFYASEEPSTAAFEMAFYGLLKFYAASPATPWPVNPAEYTGFSAAVRTESALDLSLPPLDASKELWRDPIEYEPCQTLADTARKAGAEILRYESVRDPHGGACAAVLTCAAFAAREPVSLQTWRIGVNAHGGYAIRESPPDQIEFDRMTFAADPRIATMTWERGS